MNYDELQQRVINISEGRHLVLAPPGCGKTAILAERVRMALQRGVRPADMLCLTFTNRAARGMEGRIALLASRDATEELFVGNIHRFCANYLFSNGLLPQSGNILDEQDSYSIFDELLADRETDRREMFRSDLLNAVMKFEHLLYQFRNGHPKEILTEVPGLPSIALHSLCDAAGMAPTRSGMVRLMDSIERIDDIVPDVRPHATAIRWLRLAAGYRLYKQQNNLVDFDDILLRAYDALRSDPDHKRYPWIQIDEVQDLNPVQLAVADLLTSDAPGSVALYLGDEQQAIFSFIGASLSTLNSLRDRCGENCHSLSRNYRSPRYLLELFNEYAIENLGADPERLPVADNSLTGNGNQLRMLSSENNLSSPAYVAKVAESLSANETCAVIVSRNSEADEISRHLTHLPHFKISGQDFFSTAGMQVILSHLNILSMESNFLAWTRLLYSLGLVKSLTQGRRTMRTLTDAAITPTDFLRPDGKSYLSAFAEAAKGSIVIYDTETTGLDVATDDIVQIAALRIENGKVVDTLNLMLQTNREIPPMLGDIVNPLVEEYRRCTPLPRGMGLRRFLEFARGAELVGHNVEFDYNILDYNLKRDLPGVELKELHSTRYDTLKLARLMYPNFHSHKLKDLLAELGLEGENSHLADDDILATKSLMDHLLSRAAEPEFSLLHQKTWERADGKFGEKLREKYGQLYRHGMENLYILSGKDALVREIEYVADAILEKFPELSAKLDYVKRYVGMRLDSVADSGNTLMQQLGRMIMELNTCREADLCEAEIIRDKLFIATVHKAKGLEFDNVIVYGTVDGTYPSFLSKTEKDQHEDARKLYVALTRARKRLIIHTYKNYIGTSRSGNTFNITKPVSPFLTPVIHHFRQAAK